MRTVAIAQARMGSTRVPGKVMRDLQGRPVLRWTIDALRKAHGIDEVILATSTQFDDDVIAKYCKDEGIECFRGSEENVLDRFYECAKQYDADIILRLTCDCPFIDPNVVSEVVRLRQALGADYASNVNPPTYPDGLDVECFTFEALEAAWVEASRPTDRDTVTQFIYRNQSRFKAANLTCPLPGLSKERWVLDTEDDWKLCKTIATCIGPGRVPSYLDVLRILDMDPNLRQINSEWTRNERFHEALARENLPERKFHGSDVTLSRALRTIPFGAQTFSKSHIQFPAGKAPLYCTHAQGARIFDVDGNDYVDLVSAILPVILGYGDEDVNDAIRRQLDNGISFSLATELECELSEMLCKHIPCAEMVKLGKSGTDVTTAAVRLARAYTGRDHVFLSGYHGWSDWSMARTDRNLGIPQRVRDQSHRLEYGKSLFDGWAHPRITPNEVAAIIVEPNDNPEWLSNLRRFCTHYGIVLIFDEIITGFRYHIGGAQALYGVTPDLATFGKAMANGMPISALVGQREFMKKMQPPDNIFYSGTMFGETLSIAAAIATIKKIEREPVIGHINAMGAELRSFVHNSLLAYQLENEMSISNVPSRATISFKNDKIRTLFMAEMAQNGVLIINANNMSYAHKKPEMDRIYHAYDETLCTIKECLEEGTLDERVGSSVVTAAPLRMMA